MQGISAAPPITPSRCRSRRGRLRCSIISAVPRASASQRQGCNYEKTAKGRLEPAPEGAGIVELAAGGCRISLRAIATPQHYAESQQGAAKESKAGRLRGRHGGGGGATHRSRPQIFPHSRVNTVVEVPVKVERGDWRRNEYTASNPQGCRPRERNNDKICKGGEVPSCIECCGGDEPKDTFRLREHSSQQVERLEGHVAAPSGYDGGVCDKRSRKYASV